MWTVLWCLSISPLEIILICRFSAQETFLIIINVEKQCAASYFYGKCEVLFSQCYIKNIFNTYYSIYLYLSQVQWRRTADFLRQISDQFTCHVLVTVWIAWNPAEVVLKSTRYSTQWKTPKVTGTVPCRTMQWKSAIRRSGLIERFVREPDITCMLN